MKTYMYIVAFLFLMSCQKKQENINHVGYEMTNVEYCLLGIDDAKRDCLASNYQIYLGNLSLAESIKYKIIFKRYFEDISEYAKLENYQHNIDSLLSQNINSEFTSYCYIEYMNGILMQKYGGDLFERIDYLVDSTFNNVEDSLILNKLVYELDETIQ